MKWLIWKEYRLQRLVLGAGVVLLLVPYLLPSLSPFDEGIGFGEGMGFASFCSIILSILTLALLGGNAIACERADRSAEFQAYQPIPRWLIVLSKLLLPVLIALIVWGVNLCVYEIWAPPVLERQLVFTFMLFGFGAFSVAWFVSAIQNSPTFAVGAGMAVPVATLLLLALIHWIAGAPMDSLETSWALLTTLLGITCFAAGTWHYLRRVEP